MQSFLVSIVPSAGAIFLFWLALRAVFQADRRERAAIARFEADQARSPAAPSDAARPVGAAARPTADDVDVPDVGPPLPGPRRPV